MSVVGEQQQQRVLIDGSRLMIEAMARAGADTFVGYPITPANLLYAYGMRRFPIGLPAPDEITALQWMSGFAASGHVPVTATSFPGFSLMLESVNMAYMMELPMVIIQAQRLGPSTGTATCGAMGDVFLLHGAISSGQPLLTLCPSSMMDCWELAELAVKAAIELRTPVVLLTSKEMVMTNQDIDLDDLERIETLPRHLYESEAPFEPYRAGDHLVPDFLPVGDSHHQVRLTASTHDEHGIIQGVTQAGLDNTRRLSRKLSERLPDYTRYELDEEDDAACLLVAYDVAAAAAREALMLLRAEGKRLSLLVIKTMFPIAGIYYDTITRYERVFFVEENQQGQLAQVLFGAVHRPEHVHVNAIGRMISPEQIVETVRHHD